jgi:hypothetical protein
VSGQIRTSLTFLRSALCPLSLITVITHTGGTNGMQCEEEHTLKKERRPPQPRRTIVRHLRLVQAHRAGSVLRACLWVNDLPSTA